MAEHALHVLDCGTLTLERQHVHWMAGTEPLTIPLLAFVITHPEGNVLSIRAFRWSHRRRRPLGLAQLRDRDR